MKKETLLHLRNLICISNFDTVGFSTALNPLEEVE